MAERHIPVTLTFDAGSFTGRMALMAHAAHDMNVAEQLARATWEPHDWDTF